MLCRLAASASVPAQSSPKPTDLNEKSRKIEWILPKHQSTTITDQFANVSSEHANDEEPCSPLESYYEVYNHGNGEKDDETDIGGKRGSVLIYAGFDWT